MSAQDKDAKPEAGAVPASDELDEQAMIDAAIAAGDKAADDDFQLKCEELQRQIADLQAQLDEARADAEAAHAEATEATERATRLQADWENYRRRTAAERITERDRATEKLVTSLLPVIDDLERAVGHASSAASGDSVATQLTEGVDAVRAKFVSVLEHEGVEPIDPAGEPFEPLEHQAVGRVEDADDYEDTVRDVYQRGYRMGGKVIRPAMVTVTFGGSKRPASEPDEAPADEADAASASDAPNDAAPGDEASGAPGDGDASSGEDAQ